MGKAGSGGSNLQLTIANRVDRMSVRSFVSSPGTSTVMFTAVHPRITERLSEPTSLRSAVSATALSNKQFRRVMVPAPFPVMRAVAEYVSCSMSGSPTLVVYEIFESARMTVPAQSIWAALALRLLSEVASFSAMVS
jgi:hypothetical protein